MARVKVSTTVYLEPAQLSALQELSVSTRVPMAVFVREAIDLVLEKYEKSRPVWEEQGAA